MFDQLPSFSSVPSALKQATIWFQAEFAFRKECIWKECICSAMNQDVLTLYYDSVMFEQRYAYTRSHKTLLSIICKYLMSFRQQMRTKLCILDVFETKFAAIICWVDFANYCDFMLNINLMQRSSDLSDLESWESVAIQNPSAKREGAMATDSRDSKSLGSRRPRGLTF